MNCNFYYCIYNMNYTCLLEEIKINEYGMCDECILVPIPDVNLKAYKDIEMKKLSEKFKDN